MRSTSVHATEIISFMHEVPGSSNNVLTVISQCFGTLLSTSSWFLCSMKPSFAVIHGKFLAS
jgi:hypothetical protein